MILEKEFSFPCGHRLHLHDGGCKNIHGHNYHGTVTIEFEGIYGYIAKKAGYFLDFGDIKGLLKENYDHRFLMYEKDPLLTDSEKMYPGAYPGIRIVPYMPTAENMALEMVDLLVGLLEKEVPNEMGTVEVELYETDTSVVTQSSTWGTNLTPKI